MPEENVLKDKPVEAAMRVESKTHAKDEVMAGSWFDPTHECKE